jgi:hypothetical protein
VKLVASCGETGDPIHGAHLSKGRLPRCEPYTAVYGCTRTNYLSLCSDKYQPATTTTTTTKGGGGTGATSMLRGDRGRYSGDGETQPDKEQGETPNKGAIAVPCGLGSPISCEQRAQVDPPWGLSSGELSSGLSQHSTEPSSIHSTAVPHTHKHAHMGRNGPCCVNLISLYNVSVMKRKGRTRNLEASYTIDRAEERGSPHAETFQYLWRAPFMSLQPCSRKKIKTKQLSGPTLRYYLISRSLPFLVTGNAPKLSRGAPYATAKSEKKRHPRSHPHCNKTAADACLSSADRA